MLRGIQLNWTLVAILVLLVAPQSADAGNTASPSHQQDGAAAPAGTGPILSDREKAGLRGPVEDCTVETMTPSGPGSSAWRMVITTKYGPDGRTYQQDYEDSDGSKGVESLTYDSEGHLLRAAWDTPGGTTDTIYTYDGQGRLISITGEPFRNTVFEYDDQGHKTRIMKSELKAPSSSTGNQGSGIQIESDDLIAFPPPGGLVKTLFNEHGQPIESQVYAASGDLVSRLTRTYDVKGRVADSSYIIEDFEILLPPEERERLAADPAASEEMRAQVMKSLGDQRSLLRISYIYDDEGRLSEKHIRDGSARETITKIIYNDHGDEMEEIRTTSGGLNPPKEAASSPVELYDAHFNQYDSFGNWVEKVVNSPSGADDPPKALSVTRRTITYY